MKYIRKTVRKVKRRGRGQYLRKQNLLEGLKLNPKLFGLITSKKATEALFLVEFHSRGALPSTNCKRKILTTETYMLSSLQPTRKRQQRTSLWRLLSKRRRSSVERRACQKTDQPAHHRLALCELRCQSTTSNLAYSSELCLFIWLIQCKRREGRRGRGSGGKYENLPSNLKPHI